MRRESFRSNNSDGPKLEIWGYNEARAIQYMYFVRLLQVEEKQTIFVQATLTTTRLINMSNSTHLVNIKDLNTAVWMDKCGSGRADA